MRALVLGRWQRPLSLRCLAALVCCGAVAFLVAVDSGAAEPFIPLEPGKVRLGGEIGRRIGVTVDNNLLAINIERDFVQPFINRNRKDGFIGLGMLIDSLVYMAAHTGDARVLDLKKRTVAAAIATQEPDGYLGIMVPESRIERLWDTHEMAYLIHALTSDFNLFEEKPSLAAATKIGDLVMERLRAHPDRDLGDQTVSNDTATTGLDLALLRLSVASGDPKYRQFVVEHRRLPEWKLPIIRGRWGKVDGHAYAFVDHALAQSQLRRLEPLRATDDRLLAQLRTAVDFLTRQNGLVITGACGDHECWHDTQQGTINLGETCMTAYLLRLMDDCLRRDGDGRSGDIMERAIFNALFAAQSPDGRRIRYYTPFDGPRAYYGTDTYCCPCNYRRIVAELPSLVYYQTDGGVAVNLYASSQASLLLDEVKVEIRQEADYPRSGRVVLRIDPARPAEFPLRLRIPRWCQGATVAVNDERAAAAEPAGDRFFAITRTWRAGDRVMLEMPMPWRLVKGRVAQAGRVAVARGPQVFCLSRSRNKDVKGLDTVDLRLLVLDPASI
ncbi:MAG: beta-L-arabinofuranosidase domain-containing protein, partial [Planctomycetota bacterium]